MTLPTAQYAHASVHSQGRNSRVLSRFTSLALSSLLALGLTVVAASPASAATTVQNAAELSAAFAAGGTVTLDASFAVTPPAQIAVPANGSVELDLNGHTLTILGTSNRAGIAVVAGSTLTITDSTGTNGELNVTGGANAAGIGGGELGHAGTINIAGGIIDATGGPSGAGIGGGIVGNGGTVVISGGTVRATAGEYAAAIGGGDIGGVGGSITIGPDADVTVSASPVTPRFLLGAGFPGLNLGTISNSGELTITPGSIFVIPAGTSVTNGGTLNVDGEAQNAGVLVNTGGVINVDGGITNTGTIDNAGGVLNAPVGSVVGNDFLFTFDEAYTGAPLPTLMRVLSKNFSSADLAAIPNPARAGYTFIAWVEAPTTTPFDFSDTIVSDVNLTATWAINTHTITFDSAGGSAIAPVSTDYGTTITAPNAPTRDGHTFVGWFADAATTAFDFTTPITANTTLAARWAAESRTITFDSAGGSAIAPISTDYGTTVTAPVSPTRTGYTFVGWFADAATTAFDFTTPITTNTTLAARWAVESRTITFDSAGGSAIAPVSTDYGTTITAPNAPTRDGHTFVGWYADAATTAFDFTTPITTNTTLAARWAISTHTITFDSDGGTPVAPLSTDYGTTVTAPNAPTRDGYTFVGWFADAATTAFDFTTPITTDTTLTARWAAVPTNTTTTQTVAAGAALTVSGTGFIPGQSVQVWLHSTPVMLGTLTVAANGTVSGTFSIPLETPAGLHHIVFVDQAGGEHRSGDITITAAAVVPPTIPSVPTTPTPPATVPPAAPATAAAIASTGADATGPLQIAVALLLIGAAVVGIRKHKAQTI